MDIADEEVLKQNVSGMFKHKIPHMKRILLPMLVFVQAIALQVQYCGEEKFYQLLGRGWMLPTRKS